MNFEVKRSFLDLVEIKSCMVWKGEILVVNVVLRVLFIDFHRTIAMGEQLESILKLNSCRVKSYNR